MEIKDFEVELQRIRANKGWSINLECSGIWIITINDKETGAYIASTGGTGLVGLLEWLKEQCNQR